MKGCLTRLSGQALPLCHNENGKDDGNNEEFLSAEHSEEVVALAVVMMISHITKMFHYWKMVDNIRGNYQCCMILLSHVAVARAGLHYFYTHFSQFAFTVHK